MSDAVLTRDGPVSVPLDYVVPQGGELLPLTVEAVMDGTSASGPFYAILEVIAPSGKSMGKYRSDSIAAGASADVTWFPGGELEEQATGETVGVSVETEFYDTVNAGTPLTMSTTLTSGVDYLLIVEGTYSLWNEALGVGTPEANAQFPGSGAGRVSTQVGLDADTLFARPTDKADPIGHSSLLSFSLDGGSTFSHIEPIGGPFAAPLAGHLYRYDLTGQGHALVVKLNDVNPPDNYGKFRITLQVPNGTGTGSGAGQLVPPSDATLNGDVLTVVSGVPAWQAGGGGSGTVTSVSSADTSIVVTNPTTTPSLKVGTLDVIATNEPPAANWSNNSHKITSLANGSAAQDAAAFGQIPTALPPNGSAGGNLSGTYPNPTVADVGILTTKGDLLGRSSSSPATRIAVGSDNQVLIADSTQTQGVRWGASPASAGGALTLIGSQSLSSPAASLSVGSIPGSYTTLKLVLSVRSAAAALTDTLLLQFNSDTTAANYETQATASHTTTTSSAQTTGVSGIAVVIVASTGSHAYFSPIEFNIPRYNLTAADADKMATFISAAFSTGPIVSNRSGAGTWGISPSAAITSVKVVTSSASNFATQSYLSVYGMA